MNEHQFQAPQRPQDCWDWITREDVTCMAARAFEMARLASVPPAGERFIEDGAAWTSRDQVAQDLALVFSLQIKAEAHRLGIDRGEFAQDAATLQRWLGKLDRAVVKHPEVATTCREVSQ